MDVYRCAPGGGREEGALIRVVLRPALIKEPGASHASAFPCSMSFS